MSSSRGSREERSLSVTLRSLREGMEQQGTMLQQHIDASNATMQLIQEQFAQMQQSLLSISQQSTEAVTKAQQAAQSATAAAETAHSMQHAALHAAAPEPAAANNPIFEAEPFEAESTLPPPPTFTQQPAPHPIIDLPRSLKLERPPSFEGAMDGDTVSMFIHKLDVLFRLSSLNNTSAQAVYAVTCLDKSAYTWFVAQNYSLNHLTWLTLKAALFEHFKPVDYTYQTRADLARCRWTGDVRGYVRAFRLKLVCCSDVNDEEAKFRFIDSLKSEEQRYTRLAQPVSFYQAAAIAKQIGATMQHGRRPAPQHVPIDLGSFQGQQQNPRSTNPGHNHPRTGGRGGFGGGRGGRSGSNGGSGGGGSGSGGFRFMGDCHYCGIKGHRAKDYRKKQCDQQAGRVASMEGAGHVCGGQESEN